MAEITKKEYKDGLKAFLRSELVKDYDPNAPRQSLDYWIEFNQSKKADYDQKLKNEGTTVKEE